MAIWGYQTVCIYLIPAFDNDGVKLTHSLSGFFCEIFMNLPGKIADLTLWTIKAAQLLANHWNHELMFTA
jgi:hypothetical protein